MATIQKYKEISIVRCKTTVTQNNNGNTLLDTKRHNTHDQYNYTCCDIYCVTTLGVKESVTTLGVKESVTTLGVKESVTTLGVKESVTKITLGNTREIKHQ
jgi:hypothetical protein